MCGHSQREVFPSQSKEILLSLPYLHSRHLTTGTASMVGSASSTGFPSASIGRIVQHLQSLLDNFPRLVGICRPALGTEIWEHIRVVLLVNEMPALAACLHIVDQFSVCIDVRRALPASAKHPLHLLLRGWGEGGESNLSHLFSPTV